MRQAKATISNNIENWTFLQSISATLACIAEENSIQSESDKVLFVDTRFRKFLFSTNDLPHIAKQAAGIYII